MRKVKEDMTRKATELPKEARKKLPSVLRQSLLMEAGYKCGNPTCRNVITFDVHHIEYVCNGGKDEASNLIVLCPYCHSMHHSGHIPVEAIRLWKGLLVSLNEAFDRQGMDLLLFLHKTPKHSLWFSSDGLIQFSSLIGAELVEIANTESTHMAPNEQRKFTQTSHNLKLTTRGELLIEAWLSGNEAKYRNLVSSKNQHQGNQSA